MDIWLIVNGEKTGPFRDFEIRHRIEDGELTGETRAWHEGLPAWLPLVEIDLFRREFSLPGHLDASPSDAEADALPPPLPQPPAPSTPPASPAAPRQVLFRRFWARWFDLLLFAALWWLLMWVARRDIAATLTNPWVMILQYVPWFALEAILIHHFAATPGKWLLGLRVHNLDGTRLTLAASTKRASRVLFTGVGFGWGLLAIFCQALSYFTARKLGTPLWDHAGGHTVTATRLGPIRIIAFSLLLFTAIQLQGIVLFPYLVEPAIKQFPSLKEQYERNPPWHLPKRS